MVDAQYPDNLVSRWRQWPPGWLLRFARWLGLTASDTEAAWPRRVGEVDCWVVHLPRAPRLTLRKAAVLWALALVVVAGVWLWAEATSVEEIGEDWYAVLYPWGRADPTPAHIVMKYVYVAVVFLVYATGMTWGRWIVWGRHARLEWARLQDDLAAGDWWSAARRLHRFCVLRQGLHTRLPAEVVALDRAIGQHVPPRRRLHLYYRTEVPPVPPAPTAGFAARAVMLSRPMAWAAVALVPLLLFGVHLVRHIGTAGWSLLWQLDTTVNLTLVIGLVIGYGMFYLLRVLGRCRYMRLAPGVVQLLQFGIGGRRPRIETVDLRAGHAALDLQGRRTVLTCSAWNGRRTPGFRFRRSPESIEAALRAVLSDAPTPPLPDDVLVD